MIYPKSKLSSAGASTINRKHQTQDQKEQLKRQIADRLSKKYGLDLTEQIHSQVSNYINANPHVTAEGIQNLEQEISHQKAKPLESQQSQQQVRQKEDDDQKSVVSKMSGASNFDIVDQYTHKSEKNVEEKKTQKMTGLHTKKLENDLAFLNEENQWGAIYKYNKYLYDKEGDIKAQREKERKKKLKDELDAQVNEKQQKKVIQRQEDKAFYENQLLQCDMFDQKERDKAEKIRRMRMAEKQSRDIQVKEIKKNRRIDNKQEKALDEYIISKVKEEIDDEQRFLQFKKDHQYQVMQKLMAENEDRKRQQQAEREEEKQENIRMMDAYCKLLDKQEEERLRSIKERDSKIKEYQEKALAIQEKELEQKLGQLEKRAEKYEQRKERRLQELEKEKEIKKWETKLQTREYLNKQMEERDVQRQKEKYTDQEQAQLWQEDTQNYFDFEKQKDEQKKRIYKEYQQTLLEQMKEKSQAKRSIIDEMATHEHMMTKQTLTDMDQMRKTNY